MKIDRAACRKIREEAEAALAPLAEKYGLTVKVGSVSYDPVVGTMSPKITFALEGAEQRDFAEKCIYFGLTPDMYGKTFSQNGKTFVITGINTRAPKYPIQGTDVKTGKKYKFPETVAAKVAA